MNRSAIIGGQSRGWAFGLARAAGWLPPALALGACVIGPASEGGEGGAAGATSEQGGGTGCEGYCESLVAASCATPNGPCQDDCEDTLRTAAGIDSTCLSAAADYIACVASRPPTGMVCEAPARTLACRVQADRYVAYCVDRTSPNTTCSRLSTADFECAGGGFAYLCPAEPGPGCAIGGGVRDSYLFCCAD